MERVSEPIWELTQLLGTVEDDEEDEQDINIADVSMRELWLDAKRLREKMAKKYETYQWKDASLDATKMKSAEEIEALE